MKVVQEINTDGLTITINGDKLSSNVIFTDKEATVPTNQVSNLVFRQLQNSNKIMVCTGIEVGGKWYGDRPDNGEYINPFTGETLYEGEKPLEKVQFLYKEGWNGNTIEIVRWTSGTPSLEIKQIGGVHNEDYVLVNPNEVVDTTINGDPAKTYIYHLGSTSVRFQDTEELDFKLDNFEHHRLFPRIATNNSLGVFGVEAIDDNDLHMVIDSLPSPA